MSGRGRGEGTREMEYSLIRRIERRELVTRSGSSPAFDLLSADAISRLAHLSYESAAGWSNATQILCVVSQTTAVICRLGCEAVRTLVNCRQRGRVEADFDKLAENGGGESRGEVGAVLPVVVDDGGCDPGANVCGHRREARRVQGAIMYTWLSEPNMPGPRHTHVMDLVPGKVSWRDVSRVRRSDDQAYDKVCILHAMHSSGADQS